MSKDPGGRPRVNPPGPAFDREVGRRIAAKRNLANLTKTALAPMIDRSLSTLSRYESGDLAVPTETLAKIAKVLGVKICELLDGIRVK